MRSASLSLVGYSAFVLGVGDAFRVFVFFLVLSRFVEI